MICSDEATSSADSCSPRTRGRTLAALTSYLVGRQPRGRTLTTIPVERYDLWQSAWTLPMTLLMTLLQIRLLAAFAWQTSRRAGGVRRFGSNVTVLAFTQAMPLPDMACYALWSGETNGRRG